MPKVASSEDSGLGIAWEIAVAATRWRAAGMSWDMEITLSSGRKGRGSTRSLRLTANEARKLAHGILIELDRAADEDRERLRKELDSKAHS